MEKLYGGQHLLFPFQSIGIHGIVEKAVLFIPTGAENEYNVSFGDLDYDRELLDDEAVTNNGDTDRVLHDVGKIVLQFLRENPDAIITATGSTPSRNRLYRRAISKLLEEFGKVCRIDGLKSDGWIIFNSNEDFLAFIIRRAE